MKELYRRLSFVAACVLMFASGALAQERVVSGKITDENGSGMPGVNVLIKGTSQGTATDTDGKFSLSVPNDQAVLVVTFVGYASEEVPVGSRTSVDIQLTPDVTTLTELVVTGYAVQEKKDVTGSVGLVKPAELTAIPAGNVSNQLQGRVAGVTVIGNGQPGSTSKVRIRGFGSLIDNNPLYVVDGVPTSDVSTINPNDVESLTVLKDAGAASIYGSRASNGVILITTKKGVSSGVKVNYNMYVGTQDPGKGPDNLLNTQGYADLQWLVYKNDLLNGTVDGPDADLLPDSEIHPVYGSSANASPTLPSWAADTDWYDEITDKHTIQNHDISLAGGNPNAKFYAGVNYFNQNGIINTTFTKRYGARLNSEFKIKDRVTIGENLTATHRSGLSVGNLEEGSPISLSVYRAQPIIPVVITQPIAGTSRNWVPGEWGGTGITPRLGNGPNTVADLHRNKDDQSFDVRILGNLFADVKIVDGLNVKTTFGGTFQNGYYSNYNFATYENSENVATASLNEGAYYNNDWVWTNTVTFDKKFDSHSLLVVAGHEAVKLGIGRGMNGTRAGYFSDAVSFRTLDNGASTTGLSSYFITPTTLSSIFLRADYGFNDRYLISATVRRDGSSRFGEDNRFGTFPSFTAAWRVSEESFLSGNEMISDLKIRGGYGTMGNQSPLDPSNQFFLYGGGIATSNYDLDGSGTGSVQGFRPTRIGNPNAKWEVNVTTNVGFDLALLDNKLEFVFDWYSKETDELLFNPELPAVFGAGVEGERPFINIANMKNTGIDLQLIYRQTFASDLKFEGNVTFTTYNNEIIKVSDAVEYFDWGGSRIGSFNRNEEGHSMSEFFGYKVIGLWQTDAEIDAASQTVRNEAIAKNPALTPAEIDAIVSQSFAEPGFFRFADLNGDDRIDDKDRTYIGNPNPKFTYGINLTFGWKNFDLTTFLYGSSGNDIFNYNKWWTDFWPSFQGQKSTELLNESWTPERTGADVPKASNKSNFSTNTVSSSYYVEKGSYLRMKNIQLGFNIPSATTEKIGLTSARIYLQGVNLFTATKYSGLDPELGSPASQGSGDDRSFGVDHGNYPAVKQYLIGVNIGF